ncbi:hypothetical protein [Psychrobacter sp. PL15]
MMPSLKVPLFSISLAVFSGVAQGIMIVSLPPSHIKSGWILLDIKHTS